MAKNKRQNFYYSELSSLPSSSPNSPDAFSSLTSSSASDSAAFSSDTSGDSAFCFCRLAGGSIMTIIIVKIDGTL